MCVLAHTQPFDKYTHTHSEAYKLQEHVPEGSRTKSAVSLSAQIEPVMQTPTPKPQQTPTNGSDGAQEICQPLSTTNTAESQQSS